MPPNRTSERDPALTPLTRGLVEGHYVLAQKMAWKYFNAVKPGRFHINDLISVANWALLDAGLRWRPYCSEHGHDPEANYFYAFAQRVIKGALYDYSRSEDHLPREVRDLSREIDRLQVSGLSRQEVLTTLNITDEKYGITQAAVMNFPWSVSELEETDLVGDLETTVSTNYLLTAFAKIVAELPFNEQVVIALKYYAHMDFVEIGVFMGIPTYLAQRAHTEAIKSIKEKMEAIAS